MSRVAYPARRGMCFYWVPGTRYQVLDLVAVQIGSQHRSHPIYNRPSMTPARIAALLEPFLQHALSDTQLNQISTYIDLLLRWNARMNLTAIRDPESIVTRHFGESLLAAQALFPPAHRELPSPAGMGSPTLAPSPARATGKLSAVPDRELPSPNQAAPAVEAACVLADESPEASTRAAAPGSSSTRPDRPSPVGHQTSAPLDLLDLGSGAGFPGVPIKLWAPLLRTTLLESQNKKVAFLREVVRSLTLTGIDVLPARAEAFPGASALVTLRAVENFESILPIAVRLVAPHGSLALLIGQSQIERAQALSPTLSWSPPLPIPQSASRVLLVGSVPESAGV